MSTSNIQFNDKMTKFLQIFVLLIYRTKFVGTQKQVRISHGKRAIGVRAIEVRLYIYIYQEKCCNILPRLSNYQIYLYTIYIFTNQ